MSKPLLFLISFTTLTVLLILGKPVEALAALCPSATCTVTQNPAPGKVYTNTGQITFTITNTDTNNPIFSLNSSNYTYQIWNTRTKQPGCYDDTVALPDDKRKPQDANTYVATKKLTCNTSVDTWEFKLWVGKGFNPPSIDSVLVDYFFNIDQVGGLQPDIRPVNQTLFVNDEPKVQVLNARDKQWYSFWWDLTPSFARQWKAKSDGVSEIIPIPKIGYFNVVDFSQPGKHKLCMENGNPSSLLFLACHYSTVFDFTATPPPATPPQCKIVGQLNTTADIGITGTNMPLANSVYTVQLRGTTNNYSKDITMYPDKVDPATATTWIQNPENRLEEGSYTATVFDSNQQEVCKANPYPFTIGKASAPGKAPPCNSDPSGPNPCTTAGGIICDTKTGQPVAADLEEGDGIMTVLGCIPTKPTELIAGLLKFAVGIGGGIAFLIMLYGAFEMMTSAGNPERIKAGHERMTAAVIGLLFIIFSVLLLKVIGVDILQIPGFGT